MGLLYRYPSFQQFIVSHLIGCFLLTESVNPLRCYECSESFTDVWLPLDCQVNVTAVPSRECNQQQPFCFVASMTVKGILTQITRNCIDQCFYGCVATDFGVTAITCTSCCDHDQCNTGNAAPKLFQSCTFLWNFIVCLLVIRPFM